MDVVNKIELKDQKVLEIVVDEDPLNPREDDNFTTMLCFHNGYSLGDKHQFNQDDYSSWDELYDAIIKEERPLVIKELHMYDHSGIAISTEPFSCRWDSGQIGYVWISQNHIDSIGCNIKDTETWQDYIKRLENYLDSEVNTYNDYVQGNTYGFRILNHNGDVIDSCYGFYGDDFSKNGLYDYIGKDLLETV